MRGGDPDVGEDSHVRDLAVATALDSPVHDPTAIVDGSVAGQ